MASARWFLQIFQAPDTVGLYAALYHIGHYPIVLLIGVLLKFAAPIIFNRAGIDSLARKSTEPRRMGQLLIAAAVGLTVFATAVSWFAHELLFAALVAREYRMVSWLLPVQVLGSGLIVAAQAASVLTMISAESRLLVKPRVASAAIGTALNASGAWIYGLPGVVFAGVGYGAISCAWITQVERTRFSRSPTRPSPLP